MKPPTKPPAPPTPSHRAGDEPSSGRARKDVNYVPVPFRAKVPLPSAAAPTDAATAYEDDLVEDMATPTRTPKLSAPGQPAAPPTTDWQPPSTGPIAPVPPPPPQPIAPPPPASHRHFTPPPSQQAIGPLSAPMAVPPVASSARVRQVAPMDPPPYAPPSYSSQHGPASQQHITGPQMPLSLQPTLAPNALSSTQPPNTGSFPIARASGTASRSAVPVDDGMPLGYVVASAFFLAIALVGFGLYLAFEVISL